MDKPHTGDLLDNLYIAAPCNVAWDSMHGDDRKRLCSGCSRNVFNISDMTKSEATRFLEENGTSQCMIFFRRQDGTIMTDNCPVGLRKLRDRAKFVVNAIASAFAFMLSCSSVFAQTAGATKAKDKETTSQAADQSSRNCVAPGPAPAGFKYQGNPAGGGMILVPTTTTPAKQADPVRIKGRPVMNPIPVKAQTQQSTNTNIDTAAMESFQKGQTAMAAGKKSLAAFHFEKALDAFDKQKSGDAKFRALIEKSLQNARTN